jgi:alkylhydroperoxidase/carboxymuconolactone decarboxylase family protein YurZ
MHLALYGGFPTAVEAMRIARDVFSERERNADERR